MLGDLKLVGGLWVHTCTPNSEVFGDFEQNEAHFLIRYHTYSICYNSAKPYMIHQRGHLIDKKNLSMVKWVK